MIREEMLESARIIISQASVIVSLRRVALRGSLPLFLVLIVFEQYPFALAIFLSRRGCDDGSDEVQGQKHSRFDVKAHDLPA